MFVRWDQILCATNQISHLYFTLEGKPLHLCKGFKKKGHKQVLKLNIQLVFSVPSCRNNPRNKSFLNTFSYFVEQGIFQVKFNIYETAGMNRPALPSSLLDERADKSFTFWNVKILVKGGGIPPKKEKKMVQQLVWCIVDILKMF